MMDEAAVGHAPILTTWYKSRGTDHSHARDAMKMNQIRTLRLHGCRLSDIIIVTVKSDSVAYALYRPRALI
jgi:hypothetical protein